jgi:hypothetical protein
LVAVVTSAVCSLCSLSQIDIRSDVLKLGQFTHSTKAGDIPFPFQLEFNSIQISTLKSIHSTAFILISTLIMTTAQDGTGVVKVDPWLEPYSASLAHRYKGYQKWVNTLNQHEGGLENFSKGYEKMGFNVSPNGDITYREWAPNAIEAHLIGDFSISPFLHVN